LQVAKAYALATPGQSLNFFRLTHNLNHLVVIIREVNLVQKQNKAFYDTTCFLDKNSVS
jgi:hypothetical protein